MMEFDRLPNEILKRITVYLDGPTLFRAKQTCKRWRDVVEYAETSLDIWEALCIREITTDVLAELVGFKQPNEIAAETATQNFYRDIYLKYHKQKSIRNTTDYVFTHFSSCKRSDFDCTRIKITGSHLLTGHRNGTVMLWDICTCLCVGTVANHMRPITDLAVVDYYAFELLDPHRSMEGLTVSHHHFLTASKDRTLKCVPVTLHRELPDIHFTSYVKTIRVFGRHVAVLCDDGQIVVFEMTLRDGFRLERMQRMDTNRRNASQSEWIGFWNNTLTCVSSSIDCYTSSLDNHLIWSCHPPSLVETDFPVIFSDVVAVSCYIFRNITVIITVDRYLFVSVDGRHYRPYSTLKDLKSTVTSVAISGNLLALGTNIGLLYLFYFERDSELMDIHLDRPVWSKEVSSNAIVALDIKLDAREPLIVVTDRKEVFVVRFVAPSRTAKHVGLELSRKYLESLFINGE